MNPVHAILKGCLFGQDDMLGTVVVAFGFFLSELCPVDCAFMPILNKHSCKQHDSVR